MLLDLFYPRVCVGCGKDISSGTSKHLCFYCWKQIPLVKGICLSCGNLHGTITTKKCFFCKKSSFEQLRCAGKYQNLLKQLLLDYKFANKVHHFYLLAELLHRTIRKFPFPTEIDYVIPIPLSTRKRMSRGYNQSALLSSYIAKKIKSNHMDNNLIKIKHTKSQMSLSLAERKENLNQAFHLKFPKILRNKNILLIDDIYTTGNTIKESVFILKKIGQVKHIYVGVVAM